MDFAPRAVLSPCIGLCSLDRNGLCEGCFRTGDEIARWARMSDAERLHFMDAVLPEREHGGRPFGEALRGRDKLVRALNPLAQVPLGPGWNYPELADLLPPTPPAEAAVLVGLIPRPMGTQVLLTRRTEALRHHGGQVGFPGGRIDPGDHDPLAAAIRESDEEIALPNNQLQALGYLDPFITITSFRVIPVVAVVDPAFVAVPQPAEVAEVFEVPLDFLMDPANLRRVEMEYQGRVRHVLEYTWPGQRIWGATAAILYNLRRRLEQT
ncbi:MAG: NUDIX hydrolase [Stenotrophomonas sp.]